MRCTLRKNQMWEHRESKNNGTGIGREISQFKFKGSSTVESICMCRSAMRKKRRFHRLLLLGGLFLFPFLFFPPPLPSFFRPTLFTYTLSLLPVNSPGFPPNQFSESTKISIYHPLPCPLLSFLSFRQNNKPAYKRSKVGRRRGLTNVD